MIEPVKSFPDFQMLQRAHRFVLEIYGLTAKFPKSEIYGIISKMRRAAAAIPTNIAEGFRKGNSPDTVRFMNVSQKSLEESRKYLMLVKDLDYADTSDLLVAIEEINTRLEAYTRSIMSFHPQTISSDS